MRIFTSLLLVLSLGCGDDDGTADTGTADTGTSDTGTSDTGTDTGTADTGTADTGADTGGEVVCGGFAGVACARTEYCDYNNNICGATDGTGICRSQPRGCPDSIVPVCACDGTIYNNECEANAAGQDVNGLAGGCTVAAETFHCGFRVCSTTEYCRAAFDDTGMPPAYFCEAFPAACGDTPDCLCVADELCGEICAADDDGNVTVTCPGG